MESKFSKRKNSYVTLKKLVNTDEHGTIIHFKPDKEIFEEIEFEYDTLSQRLRELAFLK